MKLKFKQQKFQADAAKAVVDVFAGQPKITSSYMMDKGIEIYQQSFLDDEDFIGWGNQKIVPELSQKKILENINKIQRDNLINPSDKLEGEYNLTIEMETGVGKTYTYIKTMYELNEKYGWSKFIIVVPSIAIREGVYKTFQVTEEHFAEEYGKKIRYFIYNSSKLTEIDKFASDNSINVMIINSQAFNARGKDARRIYMKLDEFRSRRPIDIIAKTNPIVIIDEPQSVEGDNTKKAITNFNPLMTLRYSATHKSDSIYNMVYRLDALDAYNQKLVKKIAVKGISEVGSDSTNGYVYLESINVSKGNPTATIHFDAKGKSKIKTLSRKVSLDYNLYPNSGEMEQYKDGYVVTSIDAYDNSIEFLNGIKMYAGDVIGKVSEEHLRRIQIRETIDSHFERERALFHKGIKVLSLFFIDEVAKYRQYDASGSVVNGIYADIFEEEYNNKLNDLKAENIDVNYLNYLEEMSAESTHSGYFSVDKKSGKMIDCKVGKKETTTDDVDAYDLIMKNKELLLDRNPRKSPVRFIFSHSALREGWDNPNVFQICTLKQSTSETRKRQEVGRGLRLCVNQDGERMDLNSLGNDVHNINVLTVIASESYDSFAKGLQSEFAEAIADRPMKITQDFFVGKIIEDNQGNKKDINKDDAQEIIFALRNQGYIDKKGQILDKYYEDKANNKLEFAEEVAGFEEDIINLIESINKSNVSMFENARRNNVELKVNEEKLAMPEFKNLWNKINSKSIYTVNFETDELIKKAIDSLDRNLNITKLFFKIETGTMDEIISKEELSTGESFTKEISQTANYSFSINSNIEYDLVGKLVDETGLRRKDIISILKGIKTETFDQFKNNPEEFILKVASLINDEKATAIINHITYDVLDDKYDTNIFTDPTIKGSLGNNTMKAKKHLYDHILYDSKNEQKFAEELDINNDVAVYVKLPNSFYINTPLGKYNPDWAIAFYEGNIKHIYFVAETKGSMKTLDLRTIEKSKIECAKKHFKAISKGNIVYDVVDSYEALLNKVLK